MNNARSGGTRAQAIITTVPKIAIAVWIKSQLSAMGLSLEWYWVLLSRDDRHIDLSSQGPDSTRCPRLIT